MKNLYLLILSIIIVPLSLSAQSMTPEVYELWNRIDDKQISDQGNWVTYRLTNERDRSDLNVYDVKSEKTYVYPCSKKATLTATESHLLFIKSAHPDTLKSLRRKKVKKKKLPKDTLCIMDLRSKEVLKINNVQSYKLGKQSGVVAIKLAAGDMKRDSTLVKKEGKRNGTKLLIRNLKKGSSKAVGFVTDYNWSESGGKMVLHTTGQDSTKADKVLLYDAKSDKMLTLIDHKGEYDQLSIDKKGQSVAFIANRDTSSDNRGKEELFLWVEGERRAKAIADQKSDFLKEAWHISSHRLPLFAEKGGHIYFGIAPLKAEPDSTLLDEEQVDVQIWNYKDGRIQTRQDVDLKNTEKETYVMTYNLKSKKFIQVTDEDNKEIRLSAKQKGDYHLTTDRRAYEKYATWKGHDYRDVYKVNAKTGQKTKIVTRIEGRPRLSPDGRYAYWYERADTTWNAINMQTGKQSLMSKGGLYDELNDRPMHPSSSGRVGWTDRQELVVYDHYDLWKLNPQGQPQKLTDGRKENIRYRHISLDDDWTSLPSDTTLLLSKIDFDDMSSGYALLDLKTGKVQALVDGPYRYSGALKAKKSNKILYTKENFEIFPDLILDDLKFSKPKTISHANPQQKDYNWGTMELYHWTDKEGNKRKALLAKPDNFDSDKKYPLIVNFYEKNSTRLYNHRAPYAHRSTINYTYYTSKGYIVFNPDIYYRDGYPGESCMDAVMTSTEALIDEGFIDTERMGLQGHSWGGYQIAYMLTKTNKFACAEAGAPVVNMVSAYGGIRWRSGRSRMFQYERTQSRLGYTLWERPDLYLENSPVFELDKVETPVLILHNDNDGAVPWYQGIEYFVGLRRLGKPAWMLNYRGEPHWPVKRQNRLDFNVRMEQFFDHYLMDAPEPKWMKEGVPAIDQKVDSGLELSGK